MCPRKKRNSRYLKDKKIRQGQRLIQVIDRFAENKKNLVWKSILYEGVNLIEELREYSIHVVGRNPHIHVFYLIKEKFDYFYKNVLLKKSQRSGCCLNKISDYWKEGKSFVKGGNIIF